MTSVSIRYEDLSLNALLAVALLGVEDLSSSCGLVSPQLHELTEHLWVWPTIEPSTFIAWEGWSSPTLDFALGGEGPADLVDAWAQAGLPPDDARPVLTALVQLVYRHLFTRIDHPALLRDFRTIQGFLFGAAKIRVRPAAVFADSRAHERNGWGRPLDVAERDAWRYR